MDEGKTKSRLKSWLLYWAVQSLLLCRSLLNSGGSYIGS